MKTKRSAKTILCMTAIALLLACAVLFVGSRLPAKLASTPARTSPTAEPPLPAVAPEVLHANWVRDVHADLDDLGASPSSEQLETAKQALLALRVSSVDRPMHLALVLAVVAWQQGKPGAAAMLREDLDLVGK